jgi:hypothetical protein
VAERDHISTRGVLRRRRLVGDGTRILLQLFCFNGFGFTDIRPYR